MSTTGSKSNEQHWAEQSCRGLTLLFSQAADKILLTFYPHSLSVASLIINAVFKCPSITSQDIDVLSQHIVRNIDSRHTHSSMSIGCLVGQIGKLN